MTANIQQSKDRAMAAFVTAREPAWHRLGEVKDTDGMTVEEALRDGRLADWDVRLAALSTTDHDGNPLEVDHRVATVRVNPFGEGYDVMGVVAPDYAVIQNETAFQTMAAVVDESGAMVQTAGAIGRARCFMAAKMPEGILVGGEDRTDLYLTAATSHDGSLAFTLLVTPVRVVCQNTLSLALGTADAQYRVRHTGDTGVKVAEVREALGLTFKYAEEWEAAMSRLLDQPFTDAAMAETLERLLPVDPEKEAPARVAKIGRQREQVFTLYADSPTNEFGRGTKYAALNALTEWAEWVKPRANPLSTLEGTGAAFRQTAYRVLTAAGA